jgi:ankyrin repeat protein
MDIITRIIQAGAYSVNDISPKSSMRLMTALDTAVACRSVELVRFLSSFGTHLTTKTLSLAIESRKDEMIQFLLSSGVHPTRMDLNTAVKYGGKELVRFILSSNVRPTPETLILAVRSGSKELVQLLLDAGADPDSLSTSGITPLAEAIRSKNEQIVELLGLRGAWSRITEEPRFAAALEAASEVGEIEIVRRLLSTQATFEKTGLLLPLRASIRAKHNEVAEMLLDAGFNVGFDPRSSYGLAPLLIEAVKARSPNFVRSILDAGANVNGTESDLFLLHDHPDPNERTALLEAVSWGDQTIIQDLIDSGADVNLCMALELAVEKKDAKVVQILLNNGANVNRFCTGLDRTALQEAVESCDIEMTEILLSNGADPNDSSALLAALLRCKPLFQRLLKEFKGRYFGKKGFGSSTLSIVILNGDLELMDELLASGLDPNAVVEDTSDLTGIILSEDTIHFEGMSLSRPVPGISDLFPPMWDPRKATVTPLGLGILKDHGMNILVVQKLLKAGGDPNSIVIYGHEIKQSMTALLAAIETQSLPIVKLLINARAEVNRPAICRVKRTPLQRAAEMGSFDIVQSLLNEKASVNANAARTGGGTALQLAAIGGWVGIAELLLDWGADPNAPASKVNGRNAVEGAAEHGRIDMLRLVFNAGAKVDQQLFERSCSLAEENGHLATKKYLEYLYLESLS